MRSLEVTEELRTAGHVCTGLATHRSVGTTPAAQAGLPAAKVAVTTENIEKWAAGRFGWEHDTYMNSLLMECCEDDIRANLSRVQAEHDREREIDRRRVEELEKALKIAARQINSLERDRDNLRAQHTRNQEKSAELETDKRDLTSALESWIETVRCALGMPTTATLAECEGKLTALRRQLGADRRRIEDLEKRLKTERAMKEGCQSHLLDIAAALDKSGADHEEDEPTSQRAIRVLADRRRIEELETKLAELARATRVYLSLCSCEPLQGPEVDIEDALAQAESDGPAKPAPWQVTEQSTIADLRRQLGEARAEVADLRQQVAVTVDTTAKVASEAVDRLTKENADLRAKVEDLMKENDVVQLLRAKVERRTALVEQAVGGRRSNWPLSKWFDWEHTALAELATDAPRDCEG